jgi:hypothetical protein
MPLRTGILLTGAVPVGTGISGAVRGFADLGSSEEPVIAKAIPPLEIVGEVYCSLLCRSVDLPTPEPLILRCQDTNKVMFGSVDFPHPNCTQFFSFTDDDPTWLERWTDLLSRWPAFPAVVAFDEWINNRDRNPGNLLWRDYNEFSLIDHGKAVGLDPHMPDANRLVAYWLRIKNHDRLACERVRRAAIKFALSFEGALAVEPKDPLLGVVNEDTVDHFINFVVARLAQITNLISMRFPGAQLTMIQP